MKDNRFNYAVKSFITLCMGVLCGFAVHSQEMSMVDSLLVDTTFVLQGELSDSWHKKTVKFAVTDPVKNEIHEITHSKGRFDMTVPMRGLRQEIYLYIDGTVTIPVCAGDTVNLVIGEDDMYLSASNQAVNLDLQLALALHRKMRRSYIDINRVFNKYSKESGEGLTATFKSDSLYSNLVERIATYQQRYANVVDTFAAHHGSPRSDEYFRVNGYFDPMRFLVYQDGLVYITTPGFISSDFPNVTYNDYNDSWLKYPAYRNYVMDYLNRSVHKARDIFRYDDDRDKYLLTCELRRVMAPSTLLADWADMHEIYAAMRFSGPEYAAKYIGPVYEACVNPSVRAVIARLSPEVERVSSGRPAPELVLSDIDGNRVTLDDFKGRYVYLDFWDFGCAPCIREFAVMPTFKTYFADITDRVEFVTVCASRPSSRQFADFIRKHAMDDCNLILDSRMSDSCYNLRVFPFYILIDPEGRIVEFNTERPSEILQQSKNGGVSLFEKTIKNLSNK